MFLLALRIRHKNQLTFLSGINQMIVLFPYFNNQNCICMHICSYKYPQVQTLFAFQLHGQVRMQSHLKQSASGKWFQDLECFSGEFMEHIPVSVAIWFSNRNIFIFYICTFTNLTIIIILGDYISCLYTFLSDNKVP